jgi:hypothetical protein
MSADEPGSDRSGRVLPAEPRERPLERFWPYAELAEEPGEDELARLHPELRRALFGAPDQPFSISLVFPRFDGDGYTRALALAKASDEYTEWPAADGVLRHRARFYPGDRPTRLRELYEIVGGFETTDVLIDDQPVPYARQLWLPLVWFLIK